MSSKDPFVILGLDPKGATEKDIKRAYAVKLKTTRPEDDPEGFMELRNALELAKSQLHWRAHDDEDYDDEEEDDEDAGDDLIDAAADEPEVDVPPAPNFSEGASWDTPDQQTLNEDVPSGPDEIDDDLETVLTSQEEVQNDYTAVNRAMADIATLMEDREKAAIWSKWLKILDREELLSLEAFQMISHRLRNEICERTGFTVAATTPTSNSGIAAEVFLELDARFGWSRQSITNWYESRQNTWIYRLVEAAEYKAGRKKHGAWGRPPARRIEIVQETGAFPESKADTPRSTVVKLLWMGGRIALIILLIQIIRAMLR